MNELYVLALGREDQLEDLYGRFRELRLPEPTGEDAALERVLGAPTERTLMDYRNRRKEMLLALLDEYADGVDSQAEEIGRFFDHLRQVGIRGFVADHANDPDFAQPAKRPGSGTSRRA